MHRALLSLALAATAAAQNPLSVSLNADGSYAVSVDGWPAASFASGDTGVMIGGTWVSKASGGLTPGAPTSGSGADAWGSYTSASQTWSSGGSAVLQTRVRTYSSVPAVVFEQLFPADVQTGATEAGRDGLTSSFPSFATPASSTLGWMEYRGPFIDDGTNGPAFGQWNPSSLSSGFNGGMTGGPVIFFDANATQALVFSAASDFMAGSFALATGGSELRAGLMGSASSIPAWHSHETVLWYGTGPNAAIMTWGSALLTKFGKADNAQQLDFTATHLAYNTDHGAYYYYTTGNYSNYTEALMAVYNYSVEQGIPYRALLLDSWWWVHRPAPATPLPPPTPLLPHPPITTTPFPHTTQQVLQGHRRRRVELDGAPGYLHGRPGGHARAPGGHQLEDHRPQPLLVLVSARPTGPSSLVSPQSRSPRSLVRAPRPILNTSTNTRRDNVYAKQNGGDWDFYVDPSHSPAGGQMALPLESAFWEYLLTDAVTEWGLATYEQDCE
jgi:hypothetical protein